MTEGVTDIQRTGKKRGSVRSRKDDRRRRKIALDGISEMTEEMREKDKR